MSFQERAEKIAHLLDGVGEADVLDHLDHTGIIPESFGHDSTEEKLFAKYCDALLGRSLTLLGLKTEVIAERAGSAGVIATAKDYRVVGDAKAFRLSRTAKNQKDFKVEALNTWRKGAEFAILCAPLYQYPTSSSQIFDQAMRYNVTLISYTHLAYLIRNKTKGRGSLRKLWELGKSLTASKSSSAYWNVVNKTVCEITGTTKEQWEEAVQTLRASLPAQAKEQVLFWEREKQRISKLSHEEAVRNSSRL
jgi:type II restriction enzyme